MTVSPPFTKDLSYTPTPLGQSENCCLVLTFVAESEYIAIRWMA